MITCTIIAAAAALSASAAPGLVSDAEADARAAAVLKTLTLEEKVSLLSGAGTMFLNAIPEKGIAREWTFSDNSNSIRADMTRFDWVYSHILLQGVSPTQESSPGLLHSRQTLYHLSHQGGPGAGALPSSQGGQLPWEAGLPTTSRALP